MDLNFKFNFFKFRICLIAICLLKCLADMQTRISAIVPGQCGTEAHPIAPVIRVRPRGYFMRISAFYNHGRRIRL
jgi:hypothetical protein